MKKKILTLILSAVLMSGAANAAEVIINHPYKDNAPQFKFIGDVSYENTVKIKDIYSYDETAYICKSPITVEVVADNLCEIGASQLFFNGERMKFTDFADIEGNDDLGSKFEITKPGIYTVSSGDTELTPPVWAYLLISGEVQPTESKVYINGKETAFEAYNIGDNNYFKLRDIAMALNGTEKQYNVIWDDEIEAINLIKNTPYEKVGGELSAANVTSAEAAPNISDTFLDGTPCGFISYTINNNNYYMLRNLGETFDFSVEWDEATNSIHIDTTKSYTK